MKRKTNKKYTIEALEKWFTKPSADGPVIDVDTLNNSIMVYLKHVRDLHNAMINPRRNAKTVVWKAFAWIAESNINYMHFEEAYSDEGALKIQFYATSKQLRDFLNKYGMDYEALKPSIDYVRRERRERKKRAGREGTGCRRKSPKLLNI